MGEFQLSGYWNECSFQPTLDTHSIHSSALDCLSNHSTLLGLSLCASYTV